MIYQRAQNGLEMHKIKYRKIKYFLM